MGFSLKIAGRRPHAFVLPTIVLFSVFLASSVVALPLSNVEAQRIIVESQRRIEQQARSSRSAPATEKTQSPTNATETPLRPATTVNVDDLKSMLQKVNVEISKHEQQKHLIDVALNSPNEVEALQLRATLQLLKALMSTESQRRFLDETDRRLQQLVIERTHILSRMSEALSQASANNLTASTAVESQEKRHIQHKNDTSAERLFDVGDDGSDSSASHQFNSRLICQFFVFGTIFGVVCTISACTWSLSKNNNVANSSTTANSISRLTQTPEPFDSTKPYCLKVDEKGMCYASPLAGDEIPPLPGYQEALQMSKSVSTLFKPTLQPQEGDSQKV